MQHLEDALLSYFDHKFALEEPPPAYLMLNHYAQRQIQNWLLEYFQEGIDLARQGINEERRI
jgi:hypothetical protein